MKFSPMLLMLLVAISCVAQKRKEVSSDSYDVYSAVLTQHYASWFKQKEPVQILSHTVLEPQGHSDGGCRARVEKDPTRLELLEQLLSENQQLRIADKLRLPGRYKMFTGKLRGPEDREVGIVSFSAVEFSRDRSKAMVLVAHDCGPLCGTGYVWILSKVDHGWAMDREQLNCGWVR